jgi:hypothetical protein
MRAFWLIAFLLFTMTGCATEGDKGQWAEFWKDLRGDNMKMRYDMGGTRSY